MGGRSADHGRAKEEEDHEEEESLSLCDLPITEGNINNLQQSSNNDSSVAYNDNDNDRDDDGEESEEVEFNFCDSFEVSKEYSEMCAADELFFQGQILPLARRHSVSSCTDTDTVSNRTGRLQTLQSDYIHISNASISRSESDSLDRCYSGGLTSTAASSRSSSINSHHSSSSGGSIISASKHKKPSSRARPPRLVPNNFQYSTHPSPKPQIRPPAGIKNSNPSYNRISGLWSLFRVGLMTPPEIAVRDLKNRSNSIKNYNPQSFGSRNSTSSSSYSSTNAVAKRKQPPFFFNKNGVLLFGGCKCTSNSVGPNPRKIGHDVHGRSREVITENGRKEEMKHHAKKTITHEQGGGSGGKQALWRHRTFEWLKQLSPEAASAMEQT